nr:coiled-coil domain-containing protein 22 [Onthophagus taurus]
MEEVDNIIIESLKNINCSIDEEITAIKHFEPNLVVDAVSCCLEMITPQIKHPHKLPASMSGRLNLATNLAEAIRDLGFRGDIGYQTILYCNEIELRRVLMFLIERLPRENDDSLPLQQLGITQQLKRKINENVRLCLSKPWVPSNLLISGVRKCGNIYFQQSYMNVYPLKSEVIKVPQCCKSVNENLKQYWVHNMLDVTKQCTERNLIASLLFNDCDLKSVTMQSENEMCINKDVVDDGCVKKVNFNKVSQEECVGKENINNESQNLLIIEDEKLKIQRLQDEVKLNRIKLKEILDKKNKEESILKEHISQYKIKSKTLAVLSDEENLLKLKNLVQNGNNKLETLKQQWNEVQTPLLREYEELQENSNHKDIKIQEKRTKIKEIRVKNQQLSNDIKSKEKMEKGLKEECERIGKNTGRSAYTKRILEIIGNINKQNKEIDKILDDTKQVQKEINNLNGQLDRSFTLSDELIFRNAIHDEMSRSAYKLLATLHSDCGAIIQAITELGLTERESRNLQEQIDSEVMKSTGVSLERVNVDLQNVKKEILALENEKKG